LRAVTLKDGVTRHNGLYDRKTSIMKLSYDPKTDSLYIHLTSTFQHGER
jgi:hypothetical protein